MTLTIKTSRTSSKEMEGCQIDRLPVLDHDKGLAGKSSIADLVSRVYQYELPGRRLTAVAARG
jgi:hypothetical protein